MSLLQKIYENVRKNFVSNHKKVSTKTLYRHGDILVGQVDNKPAELRLLSHLVLAEGELTGHSHRIKERGTAELFEGAAGLFLEVTGDTATLIHQEHGPIELPRGTYRVWRQREYSPQEIRTVRD